MLSVERNPFSAQNQTLRSYRAGPQPTDIFGEGQKDVACCCT